MSVQLLAVAECQQVGRVTFERAQLCVASWDVEFPAGHRIFLRPKRANPLWNPPNTGSSFLCLVPKLRMSGAVFYSPYTPSAFHYPGR